MLPEVPHDGDESYPTATGGSQTPTKMSGHPSAGMVFLKVKETLHKMSPDITNSMLPTLSKHALCLLLKIQVMPKAWF